MACIVFQRVGKRFLHRPAFFNIFGNERHGATQAVNDVSFEVARGSILVLLGPNGSGKTTILRLISTMLLPDAGRILVNGNDTVLNGGAVRRDVGFAVATERSFLPRLTGRENLNFFAALEDVRRSERRRKVDELIELTRIPEAVDTLVMKYSSGMYQRLAIARALLKSPSIVLLDEPTRSLDPAARMNLWKLVRSLRDRGTTAVVATHNFDEAAQLYDIAIILLGGRVAACRYRCNSSPLDDLREWYFQATAAALLETDAEVQSTHT